MKNTKVETRLYCMNCGKENISILRNIGRMREPGHRKKLYCPWCKQTVNMIECRTDKEIDKFKENFENGKYIEEAQESIDHYRNSLDALFDII